MRSPWSPVLGPHEGPTTKTKTNDYFLYLGSSDAFT